MDAPVNQRRLVHLTNVPTPYRIAFTNELQSALNEEGIALHVLYCAEREPNRQWQIDYSSMKYPYTVLKGVSPKIGPLRAHINPSVIGALRRQRPDWLLVAGSWNLPTGLLALNRVLSGKTQRIFWSEGHADSVLNREGPIAKLRRRVLRSYDLFAVPNTASCDHLQSDLGYRPKCLPLPNTVDEGFYSEARTFDSAAARAQVGGDPSRLLLVWVAQLVDRKGCIELSEALGLLPTAVREKLQLAFIGTGPLSERVKATAESAGVQVKMCGHLDAENVRLWLAACDGFVLPTKIDPNPLSVIEAAFAGKPLLVSRKAGNFRELVEESVTGMAIDEVTPASIATTIERFANLNREERLAMGGKAAERAELGFRREAVATTFVHALLEGKG